MSMKKKVFGKDGMLHTLIGDKYEQREGQIRMAVTVTKAILARNHLLCEGATGIGKSFGYLIPAFSLTTRQMRAEMEDGRPPVILFTSTKILQDQLIEIDVPVVSKATDLNLKVHVTKGRNNYLSWRRLKNFQSQLVDNTFQFDDHDVVEMSHFQAEALADWWRTIMESFQEIHIDGEFVNFTPDIYDSLLETETDPSEKL